MTFNEGKQRMSEQPLVGIVMGSASDMDAMEPAARELGDRGISHEINVMSAHRQPDEVADYAKQARGRGLRLGRGGFRLAVGLVGADGHVLVRQLIPGTATR